jgi:hypothetical protein
VRDACVGVGGHDDCVWSLVQAALDLRCALHKSQTHRSSTPLLANLAWLQLPGKERRCDVMHGRRRRRGRTCDASLGSGSQTRGSLCGGTLSLELLRFCVFADFLRDAGSSAHGQAPVWMRVGSRKDMMHPLIPVDMNIANARSIVACPRRSLANAIPRATSQRPTLP